MNNKTMSLIMMQRLYARVLIIMDEEKPYLDPTLNLGKLVRIVGTNRTHLSTTLNSLSKVNFNHWIATYRVNHLLEAIRNAPGKSIDELYRQSGFASRTSFFRQFRQVTGETPGEYLKKESEG